MERQKGLKNVSKMQNLEVDEPAGAMYYYDQPADMILYKGLANRELGNTNAACVCFNKLMDYGKKHLYDKMITLLYPCLIFDF